MFKEELFAGSGPITVWINAPGGDCSAASQIYTMLMDYKGDVTVKIDGIAASAASVIAMAGTEVLMAPTSLMMIHNPATIAMGDHEDMKKAISMLDEVKESIINAYEIKTSLTRDKLSRLMDAETWMNANKAVELGFADGVLEDEKTAAEIPAYAFSRKSVQAALMNKISAKAGVAPDANSDGEVERDAKETGGFASNASNEKRFARDASSERKVAGDASARKEKSGITGRMAVTDIVRDANRVDEFASDASLERKAARDASSEGKVAGDATSVSSVEAEDARTEETVEVAGRSVDELKARLETIKNYI